MPPRLSQFRSASVLLVRRGPVLSARTVNVRVVHPARGFAHQKDLPVAEQPKGPNQEQLPHVSEEAAAMGKITGEGGPDLDQGTPVQELMKRDEKAQDKAPQVLQDDLNTTKPKGSRSYSTSARRLQDAPLIEMEDAEVIPEGAKWPLPALPLPPNANLKYRYDPVVQQVTNLLMKDGKLSVAQRNMAHILTYLRTAPPPQPTRPLLPSAPPPSHLPLHPILYLTLAIDSIAPLFRIRSQRGVAGGGVVLQIPVPLGLRQRRRQSVKWILDAVSKKQSSGSGKNMFATKVAQEIVSIVEGRSAIWQRREGVHKLGITARTNLRLGRR
ncbi:MAG: hypothetical protein M1836_002479 [Candelina mexicana]|nr:MAG: hypothetical protein M1836_002479 [Candelina mexicana]